MATIFSKIINGELPGRFVYADAEVVAFLSIAPVTPGHTLVVPRQEIDQWTDADPGLLGHCVDVAQRIGQAQKRAWTAPRAGLAIVGFEVAHLHLHVYPMWTMADVDFANARPATDAELDVAAHTLRAALTD